MTGRIGMTDIALIKLRSNFPFKNALFHKNIKLRSIIPSSPRTEGGIRMKDHYIFDSYITGAQI